jgi:hypothetical protein
MTTTPKRIVILSQPDGDVVVRHTALGRVVGEFYQIASGEIHFSYREGERRRWYANKSINAFREAAAIFNRSCELHAADDHTDDDAAWSLVAAQLRSEFESIEPLGEPEASIWSATIHDTEWGLLSLY